MKFRVTLLAICALLLWLGITDVSRFLHNRAPHAITYETLMAQGAPQQWLTIQGGTLHLLEAISTSGTLELDALLVPMHTPADQGRIHLLVETRDPELLDNFRTYHFNLASAEDQKAHLDRFREVFYNTRERTGMLVQGLVADNNRDKLLRLAQEVGMNVAPDVQFLSEGQTPPRWRGFFYLAMAVAGLGQLLRLQLRSRKNPTSPAPEG